MRLSQAAGPCFASVEGRAVVWCAIWAGGLRVPRSKRRGEKMAGDQHRVDMLAQTNLRVKRGCPERATINLASGGH